MNKNFIAIFAILIVSIAGCARTASPSKQGSSGELGALSELNLILPEEPVSAKNVLEIKQSVNDGDEVVVVGRIGGSKSPFTGRSAFTIVDCSLKSCSDREGDNCPHPWDYCCEAPEDLAKATILVKFVDNAGKTLAQDARRSLGLRELQTVVIRGVARRNGDSGGIAIVGSGVFVRK